MRHRVAGRKLGRTTEHRLALLRNLSTALFDKEKIRTTLSKAKELRPFAEKLVTLSKKETLHARRQVLRHIHDPGVVSKLFDSLSARYAQRPGGYTRIIKLGPRRGDRAEMAIIELVGTEAAEAEASKPSKPARKRTGKKAPAQAADAGGAESPAKKKRPSKKKASAKREAGSKEPKAPARPTKKKTARKAATRKSSANGK